MNLVEILLQKSELEKILEDSTGELTPELEAQIMSIDVLEKDKSDALAAVFDRITVNKELLENRIDALSKAVQTLKNVEDRLKGHIKNSLITSGQKKIEGVENYFQISKLKDKIIVENEEIVPTYYKKVKTIISVDKDTVRESLNAGQAVEGVRTEENYMLRKYIKKGI